ncbi:hypothetical protein [uncultured Algimonas sp.]|uniref:hypothetical protein n=1 Tax=uncultured Algimonas sp. TaxID=1547920 RepID=UPI002616B7D2|nr:hypothetical protein [uncultured Algimonas sp.]
MAASDRIGRRFRSGAIWLVAIALSGASLSFVGQPLHSVADLKDDSLQACREIFTSAGEPVFFNGLEVRFRDLGTETEITVTDIHNGSETILTLPEAAQ